jgi:hypothetical protein
LGLQELFVVSLAIAQNAVELSNLACGTAELKVKKQSWEMGIGKKKFLKFHFSTLFLCFSASN